MLDSNLGKILYSMLRVNLHPHMDKNCSFHNHNNFDQSIQRKHNFIEQFLS